MNREKILSSITSAIGHLEKSRKLFSNKKEEETSKMVWQASSDVEYCLFLLSLSPSSKTESLSLKHKSSSKMEIKSALTSALNMLKEAKSSIKDNDLAETHEKTWQARSFLFKVQETFEKKRKIGAEKSLTTRS